MKPTRVLILIAHTGSGHLRAAEAVTEALRRRHGQDVAVDVVDALGDYAPFPFNRMAQLYPRWIGRLPMTWAWGYRLTDGRRRSRLLLRLFWPRVWPRVQRLLDQHPASVILSVHPLTNHYLGWALYRLRRTVPIITLVTDPVSVHPFWLSAEVARCLVGSAEAQRKALASGLTSDQVCVTGLPVSPCFTEGLMERAEARTALGWRTDQPTVLMVGGGEGMGQLYRTARAIDRLCSGVQMAVVAGHNRKLLQRLQMTSWRLPLHIYGFVDHTREMPRLMSAADLLITKAGPGTLHEAFLAGLPLLLSGAVPGQEEGNVRLVVEGGAGVWAPQPAVAAGLVASWLSGDGAVLASMGRRSRALARPEAAAAVADEVWQLGLTNL